MMYNLIACVNKNGLLGQANDLYIKSSKDLHYFSNVTKGHSLPKQNIIVMGFNTWVSLPHKPLKDRYNIVLSKDHLTDIDDICRFSSLESTFNHIEEIKDNFGEVFIIGGATVYEQCLREYPEQLNKLYISEIDDDWLGNEDSKYFDYSSILSDFRVIKERVETDDARIYNPETKSYIIKNLNISFKVYQRNSLINDDEMGYLKLMDNIMINGIPTETRNGLVKSTFGEKMVFNLESFPLLTTKKMGYKTILRELLWFINGSTDNRLLKEQNVHIWDGNGSKEFLVSRGLSYEEDDLGPIYGFQWRHFGAEYENCHKNYEGLGIDQLKNVIDLIRNDPTSRRIIMSAWNPLDIDKMALPPCHVLCQFSVNKIQGTIDCQLYQRSGDMFLGVPFNIASYSFLLCIICHITKYTPGKLIHILGDSHIYEDHIKVVKEQIRRIPVEYPKLEISDELESIDDIKEEYFTINNYKHYPKLSAPMIA